MRARSILTVTTLLAAACAGHAASPARRDPASAPRPGRDTVVQRNAELEKRVARLELQLLERDATIEDLSTRLDDAQAEIVRAMARLPTAASRAEAASGIAEAEVAIRALRGAGPQATAAAQQGTELLARGSAEFDRGNFGGALYLATQARTLAASARARLTSVTRGAARPGETLFAVPVPLRTTGRGNVREGPGTGFDIAFAVAPGTPLTGVAYADEWIRVNDGGGRTGWIFRGLVARP